MKYEESLKQYRDLENVIATSFEEGEAKGKIEGKIEVALNLLREKVPVSTIVRATGLSKEKIAKLKLN
jgi:predicted transposase/invertase (TIGR01784 family)